MPAIPVLLTPRGNVQDLDPKTGRVTIAAQCDFTTSFANAFSFDFGFLRQSGVFDHPRTLWVDNSKNPNQLVVSVSQTSQNFPVPPYSVVQVPVYAQDGSVIEVSSLGLATGVVGLIFYNTRESNYAYSGFSPLVPGFQVESLPPNVTTFTNRNVSLLAGVAADVFPAVAATRMLFIANIGADLAFFNVGQTAVGTFPQDYLLQPNAAGVAPPIMAFRTNKRLSVFCVNACDIMAFEGT